LHGWNESFVNVRIYGSKFIPMNVGKFEGFIVLRCGQRQVDVTGRSVSATTTGNRRQLLARHKTWWFEKEQSFPQWVQNSVVDAVIAFDKGHSVDCAAGGGVLVRGKDEGVAWGGTVWWWWRRGMPHAGHASRRIYAQGCTQNITPL